MRTDTLADKIVFIDPNNDFNNYLTWKPEDLSISVRLLVTPLTENIRGTWNNFRIDWNIINGRESEVVNFFGGRNIGNQQILTDFYSMDNTYGSSKSGNMKDALGIKTINITFDSWYLPQISITFVDVRGMAVFNPMQAREDGDDMAANFFSSLFTIPYPMFKMQIKGFYGQAVTYDLHCINTRVEMNTDTGNHEIACDFVGHTFAWLEDQHFGLIKSAPFIKNDVFDGQTYWQEQINNGRFKISSFGSSESLIPMPTIVELENNIANIVKTLRKFEGSYEVQDHRIMVNKLETIRQLRGFRENVIKYLSEWGENTDNIIVINRNNTIGFTYNSEGFTTVENDFDINTARSILNRDELISEVVSFLNTNRDGIVGRNSTVIDNLNGAIRNFNDNVNRFNREFGGNSNTFEEIRFEIEGLFAILDFSSFIEESDIIINNYSIQEDKSSIEIAKTYDDIIRTNIQFNPTIGNILKIIFAHVETFYHVFSYCVRSINYINNTRPNDRFVASVDLDEQTDLSAIDGRISIPPFFRIALKENKMETWVGDSRLNIPPTNINYFLEIPFIKAIIESFVNMQRKTDALDSIGPPQVGSNSWLPINPFDVSKLIRNRNGHNSNPYQFIRDINTPEDLITQIGIRMFWALSTNNTGADTNMTISLLAKSDATNIVNAFGASNLLRMFNTTNEPVNHLINLLLGDRSSLIDGRGLNSLNNRENGAIMSNNEANNTFDYVFFGDGNRQIIPLATKTVGYYNSGNTSIIECSGGFIQNPNIPFLFSDINALGDINIGDFNQGHFDIINFDTATNTQIRRLVSFVKSNSLENSANLIDSWSYERINDIFVNDFRFNTIKNNKDNSYSSSVDGINRISRNDTSNNFRNHRMFMRGNSRGEDVYTRFLNLDESNDLTVLRDSQPNFFLPNVTYTERLRNNNTSIISLFGSIIYHQQNRGINERDKKISQRHKAFLFLNCLGLDLNKINKLFELNQPTIKIIPKVAVLIVGSYLWREENQHFQLMGMGSSNSWFHIPFTEGNEDIRSRLTNIFKDTRATAWRGGGGFQPVTVAGTTGEVLPLNNIIKRALIHEFEKWVNSDFANIENQLGLLPNLNGEQFKTKLREARALAVNENGTISDFDKIFESETAPPPSERFNFIFLSINSQINVIDDRNTSIALFNNPEREGSRLLNTLYSEDILMINGTSSTRSNKISLQLNRADVTSYLQCLCEKITELTGIGDGDPTQNRSGDNQNSGVVNDLIATERYKYFRQLYDRWIRGSLIGNDVNITNNTFKLERFMGNPITEDGRRTNDGGGAIQVLDKLHRDISQDYIVNLTTLDNLLRDARRNRNFTLLQFLSRIFSSSQMMFIPTPNYANPLTRDGMRDIFTPIPFSKMDGIGTLPRFIAMYTGSPAEIGQNLLNGRNSDGMNFVRTSSGTTLERHIDVSNKGLHGHKGFAINSFAVSYGQQNQSYFKRITMSNHNPIATEHSIIAEQNIVNMSGDGSAPYTATGQDLYSIFHNNSYVVEVEMMGCAQIQPLMYFQLFNAHLFSGAYMIFQMSHTISAGRMSTTFKGIKMSRFLPHMATEPLMLRTVMGTENQLLINAIESGNRLRDLGHVTSLTTTPTTQGNTNKQYGQGSILEIADTNWINFNSLLPTEQQIIRSLTTNVELSGARVPEAFLNRLPQEIAQNLITLNNQIIQIRQLLQQNGLEISTLNSGWRTIEHSNPRTFHGLGGAVDFNIRRVGTSTNLTIASNREEMVRITRLIRDNIPCNQVALYNNRNHIHYAFIPGVTFRSFGIDRFW